MEFDVNRDCPRVAQMLYEEALEISNVQRKISRGEKCDFPESKVPDLIAKIQSPKDRRFEKWWFDLREFQVFLRKCRDVQSDEYHMLRFRTSTFNQRMKYEFGLSVIETSCK